MGCPGFGLLGIVHRNDLYIGILGAVVGDANTNQWLYTTRQAATSASVKIVVDVADLAGQVAEVSQHT